MYHHRRIDSTFTTFRSTKRIKSVEKTIFSDNWVVDKIKFLKDFQKLHENSENYWQNIEYTTYRKQANDEFLLSEALFWDNIFSTWIRKSIKLSKVLRSFADFNSLNHCTIESNLLNMTSDSNHLENSAESANDSSNTTIDSTHRN